ncbi:MAG: hypothetical protein AAGC76_09380 [Luteibacter sp.]|uniref:hypothetical protein n=1 Tax=Luteibacter sp. TaxID=1886636 RepID=UPI002806E42B|nr:hypothetical protein [Luteibacter sp.]MDQ7996053.1 hypothetical protein [Luteibacter sp.]
MAGKKIVLRHPAYQSLLSAAKNIESAADVPAVPQQAVDLLQNARANVRSAVEVLMERDPLKHRLGMICLMIQESTTYKLDKIDGQMVEVVEVTDDYMFSWAVRELHGLAVKFKS